MIFLHLLPRRGALDRRGLLRWVMALLAFVGIILLIGLASAVAGPTGESVLYLAFLVVGFVVSRARMGMRDLAMVSKVSH